MQNDLLEILNTPQKPITTLAYLGLYFHFCHCLSVTVRRLLAAINSAWDRANRIHQEVQMRREEMELQKIKSGHFPKIF